MNRILGAARVLGFTVALPSCSTCASGSWNKPRCANNFLNILGGNAQPRRGRPQGWRFPVHRLLNLQLRNHPGM